MKFVVKLQDLVSKVTVHSDSNDGIVKAILDSVKKTEPKVIVKNKPWRTNKWMT